MGRPCFKTSINIKMTNYRAWPHISEVKTPMLAASSENGLFMEKDCFGALEPFAILMRMVAATI
jgi:hypothetical protein